ncbi:SAM-dependent methyltransferase [Thermomonospora umbrina]|uniref:DNA-binding SARP family transcriptional activator n=1 Tax=Thermomonospora umbrina TaxID=111806 RepID=A0A3D9SV54_9ACTN|nr:SAM-dependent methyltransferase [Thermomonospora umbrina]REE97923.1 DNA-binding SARP family transcriptional activator [Thermomonospora umbrina]
MLIKVLSGSVVEGETTELTVQPRAALLALVEARGALSASALMEVVWEQPPRDPRAVIKLMSKLREVVGADRIVHEAAGYRFTDRPGDYVDLWAWRALADRAAEIAVDDPHAAEPLYRRTLSLWPEPPLAGLPATIAMDTLRRRLLDERLDALERRAEVQLRLGRHRQAAAELPRLVEEEPQREHLLSLLMLALYRAGRPSEAYRHYLRLCDRLAREKGPRPGRALQRLAEQIQSADPALEEDPAPLPATDRAVIAAGGEAFRVSIARMEHYVVDRQSGAATFATARDRAMAEYMLAVTPETSEIQREADRFGARCVRRLVIDHGIEQILELGAPIPNRYAPHAVARLAGPGTRVVYVHRDPSVVEHSQRLAGRPDSVVCVCGTLRDPLSLVDAPEVRRLIDWSRPVAIIDRHELNATPAPEEPARLLAALLGAAAPGSFLVVAVLSAEAVPDRVVGPLAEAFANAPLDERLVHRTRAELAELVPPGWEVVAGIDDVARIWNDRPNPPGLWQAIGLVAAKPCTTFGSAEVGEVT